jgi:hypothetical protein
MQREREAELIFRGGQYIEAIRLYKARYGRNPMRLKEIWEADPKVIRRKFKDPITDSENWGIVFVGQEGQSMQAGGGGAGLSPTGTPVFETDRQRNQNDPNSGLPPGVQRDENGELMGPIAGVHSTSCEQSIRVYEGRTTYCEWRFVHRDDQRQRGGRQLSGGGGRGGGGRGGGEGGGGYHGGDKPRDRGGSDPRVRDEESRRTPRPNYTPGPRRTGTPRF